MNAVRNVGAPDVTARKPAVGDTYLNRELSTIDFNARVLALSEDAQTPLLERAKFLAIFASNLDEFFQVRVAGLKQQAAAGVRTPSSDGLTPREQLSAISAKVVPLAERHSRLFSEDVMPALRKAGVKVLRWAELDEPQRDELNKLFREKIFQVLTPLAVDSGRPFPYISNLSLNLAVLVRDSGAGRMHFARIKVPPILPRFVSFAEDRYFTPLEEVIAANLDQLFPGMEVVEHHTFRVTRNADLEIDDGADDLLEALEEQLAQRRARPAVRLEVEQTIPQHVLELLMSELEVGDEDVYMLPAPLDLSGLWGLHAIDRPDLKDEPYFPVTHPDLSLAEEDVSIFEVLGDRDVLVHHPYESFTTSVQRFIEEAAVDPDVLAIKQTLYRTAGSPIVNALIEAAERGKQVVVLIEIKARFDESANIAWARTLEKAGCHVVYGLAGLKTHCKLCLVVRDEGGHLKQYVHVGTGNYNPMTARIYEDMGLFTADPELAAEVGHLFNYITGFSRDKKYRCMIVAPHGMRDRMLAMIEREAALTTPDRPGRIIMKMNALSDDGIVNALYNASEQGVKVDLIVRSICTLRPGVKGLSKNISVRSILGRFLEHSRIFYFENGGDEQIYIGSADMMPRNLDWRVEALAVVKAPELREQLKLVLDLALSDNFSAWTLDRSGKWQKVRPGEGEVQLNFQEQLMRHPTGDA
ncbi:MAG TPA: RNA degradosome polyphosphate kinase [Solirubrobacterales bacterium]|nr:RNA degradosome polyphosphate kinase [Solirubrobacterales bacterium]